MQYVASSSPWNNGSPNKELAPNCNVAVDASKQYIIPVKN